jgi:hypothetical protein
MKRTATSLLCATLLLSANAWANTITLWNFNSQPSDFNPATGTTDPAVGTGVISTVGGATGSFANLAANGSDPENADNSEWRVATWPAQGTANKTAGIQLSVDTTGYENIAVSWDHYNSATGSRFWRVQYTTNGLDYYDHDVRSNGVPTTFQPFNTSFVSVPGVNNNPNFGMRLVTEWVSTATGSGADQYVGVSSTYGTAGTLWLDMVHVTGDIYDPNNTQPLISSFSDLTTRVDTATAAIPFTVEDGETLAADLLVSATAADPSLISNFVFGGAGTNRNLTIVPASGQTGATLVTVRVTDVGGKFNENSFVLTILPANTPPFVTGLSHLWTLTNTTSAAEEFTVGDLETAAGSLVVTATSANQDLVANSNITLGGANDTRTIAITPTSGAVGNAPIQVVVSDGTFSVTNEISLRIVPNTQIVFNEFYDYPDGLIVKNSGALWVTHLGVPEQVEVRNRKLWLTRQLAEDISASLIGSPYLNGSGTILYARFKAMWQLLPGDGDYFAHFKDDLQNYRCRISVSTNGAASGKFRFGIRNNTGTAVYETIDRDLNTEYVVVARYDTTTGASTIWINPSDVTDETTNGLEANDASPVLANGVQTFAFRQNNEPVGGIGRVLVDDLIVGLNFADTVFGGASANTPPTLSAIANTTILAGTSANIPFTVTDAESLNELEFTVESTNPDLLPPGSFSVTGTGNNRTLVLTPPSGQAGAALVRFAASDATFTASQVFMLKVQQPGIIALWNFNSVPPDGDTVTGTLTPAIGSGTAAAVGGATEGFAALGAASYDPAESDNSKWRIAGWAAQTTENKNRGVEFQVSTVGYTNVALSWDHYNSATGTRHWRVQYSTNGVDFLDHTVFTVPWETTFFPHGASFTGLPGVDNNPDFAIRIVNEFQSTATGTGEDRYLAAQYGANYGTGGTLWLDSVTISGRSLNEAPSLSIELVGGNIRVIWPTSAAGYSLQSTTSLSPVSWGAAGGVLTVEGDNNVVTLPATGTQFFRLQQ